MEQAEEAQKKSAGPVSMWGRRSVFAKFALCRTRPGLNFYRSIAQTPNTQATYWKRASARIYRLTLGAGDPPRDMHPCPST